MDFSWFLTIPGMLITGGVLLLIIALIIFIATSNKKGKKENEVGVSNSSGDLNSLQQASNQPQVDSSFPAPNNMNIGTTENLNIEQPSISISSDNNLNPISPVGTELQQDAPTVTTAPIGNDSISMNTEPVIEEQPTMISVNDINNFQKEEIQLNNNIATPAIEQSEIVAPNEIAMPGQPEVVTPNEVAMPEQPEIVVPNEIAMPVQPEVVVPNEVAMPEQPEVVAPNEVVMPGQPEVVAPNEAAMPEQPEIVTPNEVAMPEQPEVVAPNEVIMSEQPEVVVPSQVSTETSIYGGANPAVSDLNMNQNNSHQIYGGADPLEKTQVISTQNLTVSPMMETNSTITPEIKPEENVVITQQEVQPLNGNM